MPDSSSSVTEKQLYDPPTATFVPLQVEERLMTCLKMPALPGCIAFELIS